MFFYQPHHMMDKLFRHFPAPENLFRHLGSHMIMPMVCNPVSFHPANSWHAFTYVMQKGCPPYHQLQWSRIHYGQRVIPSIKPMIFLHLRKPNQMC